MTTKVTVDAHAGWPVQVTQISLDTEGNPAGHETKTTVPPNTVQDFYIHSTMKIECKEMPFEPA
jgi:hypothetical protein